MPLGVVLRRLPGVTRWAKWTWRAVSVLPGAPPAHWQVLREEDGAVEFHAATLPLVLHRSDTEAYLHELAARVPSVYVILRQNSEPRDGHTLDVVLVTASPYEGQDYADSGEEIVERVPMPASIVAWVREFVERHHEPSEFVKRKRSEVGERGSGSGIGDPRIFQLTDVYRPPGRKVKPQ